MMNIKEMLKACVFMLFSLISLSCYSQSGPPVILVGPPMNLLEVIRLEYNKPVGFNEIRMSECFKSYPKLNALITCAYSQFESKDKHFFLFTNMYKPLSPEDSIFISKISPNKIKTLDWMHEANIKGNIRESLGEDSAINWRSFVHYGTLENARKFFNADSLLSYTIKLDPKDAYQGKFNNLEVLCIAKKRRGVIYLFELYTDEGKRNLKTYQKELEGIFRFKE
jgi:hypothetical protein